MHSAKYYRQQNKLKKESAAFRNQCSYNPFDLNITIRFLKYNMMMNDIIMNINNLEYHIIPSHRDATNLWVLNNSKEKIFILCQRCFECNQDFYDKCTVLWSYHGLVYKNVDDMNKTIKNILLKFIPLKDIICNILLPYLGDYQLFIAKGIVNKSWFNFADNCCTERALFAYSMEYKAKDGDQIKKRIRYFRRYELGDLRKYYNASKNDDDTYTT